MLMTGFRGVLISGYIGCDYAALSHKDSGDCGPTVGVRLSKSDECRPNAHHFVYPTLLCGGRSGIIIEQPFGAMTIWFGGKFEHTSSIDEHIYDLSLQRTEKTPHALGVVCVQKKKLLTVPKKRRNVMEEHINFEIMKTAVGVS